MTAKKQELRSDVRADLKYEVRYKIITREEFELTEKKSFLPRSLSRNELKISTLLSDNTVENGRFCEDIAGLLLRIDEKLDRILFSLSEKEENPGSLSIGTGVNISASGMNIITEKPFEKGQLLFTKLILSRLPFVSIDVYGEVLRITGIKEKDAVKFEAGIKFIDPDPLLKEKIISYVFRQQRREIQKKLN